MHTAFRWGIRKETDHIGDNFKNTSSITSIGSMNWIDVAQDKLRTLTNTVTEGFTQRGVFLTS